MDYGKFEPRIHDFGDNYHKLDEELYLPSFNEVRQLKRVYRNYNDYLNALDIIKRYISELSKKYGEDFLWYYDLGDIKEFIPPIPRYKKTDENIIFSKLNVRISNQTTTVDDSNYRMSDEIEEAIKNSSENHGDGFEFHSSNLTYLPGYAEIENSSVYEEESDTETVSRELALLRAFQEQQGSDSKSDISLKNIKKEEEKRMKALAKLRRGKSIYDKIKESEENYNGVVKDEEESSLMFYRGISISRDDLYRTKVIESFVKAGLYVSKSADKEISNKELRKMIKKERKEMKELQESKTHSGPEILNNALEEDDSDITENFGDGGYEAWEDEMRLLRFDNFGDNFQGDFSIGSFEIW